MNAKLTLRSFMAAAVAVSLSTAIAHADDLVVSATSQTSDDYALAVTPAGAVAPFSKLTI